MAQIKLRLNTKIVLLCAGLVFLTTLVIQVSTWVVTNRFYQQQLRYQVDNAKQVLEQFLSAREQLLVTAAQILTADFGFIRAVATSDADTIQSALSNHGSRIHADLMLLLDRSGQIVSFSSQSLIEEDILETDVQSLIKDPGQAHFFVIDTNIYQLIMLPVRAPHTIAYTVMGFQIDVGDLMDLKSLTGLDISFYSADQQLLSSMIRLGSFAQFKDYITNQTSSWLFIKRPAYMSDDVLLKSTAAFPVHVLLTNSMKPIYQQYDEISWNNTLLALSVAILAVLLSMAVARGLTVQLAKLTELAEAFAKGNYLKEISDLNGGVEVKRLTKAFRKMGQEVKKREEEIRYHARHDLLTGLFNLYTLRQILDNQLSRYQPMMLIALNIQNFRQINDRLGVDIADECLRLLADRLKAIQAQSDMLAGRSEGAEFIVILPFTKQQRPNTMVEALTTELAADFEINSIRIKLNLIAGVCLYPEHGETANTLLRRTHIALDSARKLKTNLHCYEQGDDEAHLEHLLMIEALKKVISMRGDNQLFMAYQPKIALHEKAELRVESLIRWQRKDYGFVSPELFINVAEQSALIVELTQWVFQTVVEQIANWSRQGINVHAAINVSAQDILHPNFLNFVLTSCQAHGVSPKQVTIELTERDIMHDEAQGIVSLRQLKQAGFYIAIDDYGIGQSSLSKLKGLAVDEIKLDKSFIQHLDQSPKDQLIVKSTIELAHGLGFKVVAEGVENQLSMALLEEMGCDFVQGYYISKPIPAEQIVNWQQSYVEDNHFYKSQSA